MTPRLPIWNSDVQSAVARVFKVSAASLVEPSPTGPSKEGFEPNPRPIQRARQAAMYLAHKLNAPRDRRHSLVNIGRWFGGRDHTTVLHAIRMIDARRTRDPELAGKLEEIEWGLL